MNRLSLNRTLALLWTAIGVLLLLLLVGALGMIVVQAVRNAGAAEDAVRVASETRPARQAPRAVRYGAPAEVRGTATRLVLVRYGKGEELSGGYASYSRDGAWVNVVFIDGGEARLLLDRPGYIQDIAYPGVNDASRPATDSLQTWITYVMAVEDTDRNGQLDHRDRTGLYVSTVDGRNLRPVLAPPLRYSAHHVLDAQRMLVYALEPPAGAEVGEDRMRQRAFIYDMASGRLSPYTALDSAAERAGRILQR